MKKLIIGLLILFIGFDIGFSQVRYTTENYSKFGLFGNYNYNMNSANFQRLPGVPNCCPKFESGTGGGITIGAYFEMPLMSPLSIQFAVGYTGLNSLLKKEEPEKFGLSGQAVDGVFEHRLDAELSALIFQPSILFNPFDRFYLSAGLSTGMTITKNYSQIEVIKSPEGAVFYDEKGQSTNSTVRNDTSGQLPGASSVYYGISFGLGYEFPINKTGTLALKPEVNYTYFLNPVVKDIEWNISSFKAGLTLRYSTGFDAIYPSREEQRGKFDERILAFEDELEVTGSTSDLILGARKITPDEEKTIESGIIAKVKAVFINEGIEFTDANLQVEEFLSTTMIPLLNYIFFPANSDFLPSKYIRLKKEETDRFRIDKLVNVEPLTAYYNILNVIGLRMRNKPDAIITMTGCNSDIFQEKGNSALSEKRAKSVADYLINVWDINPKRIIIKSRNLPQKFSNNSTDEGKDENRRVEISVSPENKEILEPIIVSDTLRKSSPQLIKFYNSVSSQYKIKKWDLAILQEGNILKEFGSEGEVPETLDWHINREKGTMPKYQTPLLFNISVLDANNAQVSSPKKEISVEQITIEKKRLSRLGDKKIDRYSLLLFDFDASTLSPENKKISEIIKNRIEKNSRVLITGYTDLIGEYDYNQKLSEDRAKNLMKELDKPDAYTRGLGESVQLYDNSIPEGRFYCRTIEVEVETPIKW